MQGRIALVTGASSGIGEATATGLARLGAHVVMVSRTAARGEAACARIRRRCPSAALDLLIADLSTTGAVRTLADRFASSHAHLDVLVNNAGLITRRRRLTPDGIELQLAVNHLAPFLLTGLLLGVLRASGVARILTVASTAHSRGILDFEDLQMERRYRGWQMYANTKLMNVLFTYELARRLAGTGVTANCLHPGVIRTGLMRGLSPVVHVGWKLLGGFFKQAPQGAQTPVYLAASPEIAGVSGKYFRSCRPLGTSAVSYDREVQRRLWLESERLTGFAYPDLAH